MTARIVRKSTRNGALEPPYALEVVLNPRRVSIVVYHSGEPVPRLSFATCFAKGCEDSAARYYELLLEAGERTLLALCGATPEQIGVIVK